MEKRREMFVFHFIFLILELVNDIFVLNWLCKNSHGSLSLCVLSDSCGWRVDWRALWNRSRRDRKTWIITIWNFKFCTSVMWMSTQFKLLEFGRLHWSWYFPFLLTLSSTVDCIVHRISLSVFHLCFCPSCLLFYSLLCFRSIGFDFEEFFSFVKVQELQVEWQSMASELHTHRSQPTQQSELKTKSKNKWTLHFTWEGLCISLSLTFSLCLSIVETSKQMDDGSE